jgi:hypothetical protein
MNGGGTGGVSTAQGVLALDVSVEARKNDIISKMWDSYIENLREIADRIKKEDIRRETVDVGKNGLQSGAEYFSSLMALSANSLTGQFNNTYNQWLVNPIDSGSSTPIIGLTNGGYPDASFIAGCVACNPDAIRNAVGGAALGVQLSTSPIADALFAVGPTSGLPGDYQAAAALVAALLNGGAVYKATADTMVNPTGAQPQYDLNFAASYAKNVMAIVTKNIGAGDPLDPHRASQSNMIRLMLSAMALNMVYRAAYGGMQGKEFGSLLAGNTADLPEQIKGLVEQLVGLVNYYLPTDPKSREETIAGLMEYVDSKDSVDSMLQTSHMFASFLNTGDVDAERLASEKN